jgi:hypothetical protein
VFIKVNKTAIVVISAHARFISALPIFLFVWVFACCGPSAFYLAVVEQIYLCCFCLDLLPVRAPEIPCFVFQYFPPSEGREKMQLPLIAFRAQSGLLRCSREHWCF